MPREPGSAVLRSWYALYTCLFGEGLGRGAGAQGKRHQSRSTVEGALQTCAYEGSERSGKIREGNLRRKQRPSLLDLSATVLPVLHFLRALLTSLAGSPVKSPSRLESNCQSESGKGGRGKASGGVSLASRPSSTWGGNSQGASEGAMNFVRRMHDIIKIRTVIVFA